LAEARGFIQHVEILEQRVQSFDAYPFSIPAVRALRERLVLHPQATVIVGENGTGKSTVVEGIAVAAGASRIRYAIGLRKAGPQAAARAATTVNPSEARRTVQRIGTFAFCRRCLGPTTPRIGSPGVVAG
jgi:predicted ATPase